MIVPASVLVLSGSQRAVAARRSNRVPERDREREISKFVLGFKRDEGSGLVSAGGSLA